MGQTKSSIQMYASRPLEATFWMTGREDEHAVPRNRKGSFLVVGDWGWDHLVHGNVPKADCQAAWLPL